MIGRSMIKNLNISRNLGYADVPDGVLVEAEQTSTSSRRTSSRSCAPGSQGEPLSALTRMAFNDHRWSDPRAATR